jgi:hypothetical protein
MAFSLPRLAALTSAVVALTALALAGPVAAKTDPKDKKPVAQLRWAHSYAAAMAEAKDRGCVVFATFHEDG